MTTKNFGIFFRCTQELHESVSKMAKKNSVSRSAIVKLAITDFLEKK